MTITYNPSTNFGQKDALPVNDPDKVIYGAEFTTEFNAIQTAFSSAAPTNSPTFTGTVTFSSDVALNGSVTIGTESVSDTDVQGWNATKATVDAGSANWDEAYAWGDPASAGYFVNDSTMTLKAPVAQIARPSDFWSNHYIGTDTGHMTTQGNYDLHITSNGYRNDSGTWTSSALNGKTGASQIALDADGEIGFNTEAVKATGDPHSVTRRMTLTDTGLTVTGDVAASGEFVVNGAFRVVGNSPATPNGNAMYRPASNTLAFCTNSTERLLLGSTGIATFKGPHVDIGDFSGGAGARIYDTGSIYVKYTNSGASQIFRGYGGATQTSWIAANGDASFNGTVDAGTVSIGDFNVSLSGSSLRIDHNGTALFRIDSSGNVVVKGNITAYGNPS